MGSILICEPSKSVTRCHSCLISDIRVSSNMLHGSKPRELMEREREKVSSGTATHSPHWKMMLSVLFSSCCELYLRKRWCCIVKRKKRRKERKRETS